MLTPRLRQRPLMPSDRAVMDILGMSAKEYREFQAHAESMCRIQASKNEPQAFIFAGGILAAVGNLAVGLVLSVAASLLIPRQSGGGESPRAENRRVDGQDLVRADRFAAKSGFDSIQNVVELGSRIPLVYAKREEFDGIAYGGVRVNANLLWSQLLSLGGNQVFRGIYMFGQGGITEMDSEQFALGDNLLTGYGLGVGGSGVATTGGSKITIYQRLNGGRILQEDYIIGRQASEDPGNFQNNGAPDVYQIPDQSNAYRPNASSAVKPSTQTVFGVYDPIGVTVSYKVNPRFRPATRPFFKSKNNGDKYEVDCEPDQQVRAERQLNKASFHPRLTWAGKPNGAFNINPGDTLTLNFSPLSDGDEVIEKRKSYPGEDSVGEVSLRSAAQAVAGRQAVADDSIVVGERYLVGTAQVVCTARSNDKFVSAVDNDPYGGGQAISATFRALTGGISHNLATWNQDGFDKATETELYPATQRGQLMKLAIASFVIPRRCRVVEIGIRSTVGIQISGLCNFSDLWGVDRIDDEACQKFSGDTNDSGQPLGNSLYSSGQVSLRAERYSFWRIAYRRAGTNDTFTTLSRLYGARGKTGQAIYNYLRIAFPSDDDWEIQLIPVSGFEAAMSGQSYEVLDFKKGSRSVSDGGLTLWFNGEAVSRNTSTFGITVFVPKEDIDIDLDSGSAVDRYAKLAEVFPHDEVTCTAQQGPEHEISYVNIFAPNATAPGYDDLTIVGMNVRAGPELTQLAQFSGYVLRGLRDTHLFPEVLEDLLTNPDYRSTATVPAAQIDSTSFDAAATWTQARRYFFDGVIAEPINRRSWASETAQNFLLDLVVRNGKWYLQPVFDFVAPEPITALFTAGNIISGSFRYRTVPLTDREPVRVSVRWRQERQGTIVGERGLFPVIRELSVAEAGTPANARVVTIDMSDYCTSERHAIDVGKFRARIPRLQQSVVAFRTWPQAGTLIPGRSFKIGIETTSYETPATGAIASDLTVTTFPPLADGTYDVLLWSSGGGSVDETSITIAGGKADTGANSVFCLRNVSTEALTVKASRIELNEDGEVEVEAIAFPVDANGISLFAEDWDEPTAWEIEGAVNPPPLASGPTSFFQTLAGDPLTTIGGASLVPIPTPS